MDKNIKKTDESLEGEIVPYSNPGDLAKFMDQPLPAIAEAVTGALETGKSGLLGSAGRVLQGALKGKAVQQFGKEFTKLREKGAIKEDYAEKKYGYQSLAELLSFIDDEAPDPERLRAVKAMFFNIVSANADPGEEILNYKLFILSMKLNATQLAILSGVYKIYLRQPDSGFNGGADAWLNEVASVVGSGVKSLVESEEKALEDYTLITPRKHADRSGIDKHNCRLTELGLKFCQHQVAFEDDMA